MHNNLFNWIFSQNFPPTTFHLFLTKSLAREFLFSLSNGLSFFSFFFRFFVAASSSICIEDGCLVLASSTFECEDGRSTSVSASFSCEKACCVGSSYTVNLFWYQSESSTILMEIMSKEPRIPDWQSNHPCTVNESVYFLGTIVSSYSSAGFYELIQLVSVKDFCILIPIICTDDVLQIIVLLLFV